MIFNPKKTKYKKQQKGGSSFLKINKIKNIKSLVPGLFGIKVLTPGILSAKQLESTYNCINKIIKKTGKLFLKVFPHTPITKKPVEVRMGKGKGSVNSWSLKVSSGTLLFEIAGSQLNLVVQAFRLAKFRLPLKIKLCYLKK